MERKNEQIEFDLFEWDYDFEKQLEVIKLKLKNGDALKIYCELNYDMADIFLVDANRTIQDLIKNIKCRFIFFPKSPGIMKIDSNSSISIVGWYQSLFIDTQFEDWKLWLKSHKEIKFKLEFFRAYLVVKILKII